MTFVLVRKLLRDTRPALIAVGLLLFVFITLQKLLPFVQRLRPKASAAI